MNGDINDATDKIVGLYLTKNVCRQEYFETVRQIIINHGKPLCLICQAKN